MTLKKHKNVLRAASYLKVHPTTVYMLLRVGRLNGIKLGRAWQIPEESLAKYYREATHLSNVRG
jgi:excisionase family DNA binding protein